MEVFPKRKELAIAQTAFRSSRKNLHFSSRFSTTCRSSEGGLKRASLFEVGAGVNGASLVFGLICFCVPYRRDYKYISPKNIHFNERSDVSSRMSGLTFWAWSVGAFRSVKNKKLFERSEFFLFSGEKCRSSSKSADGSLSFLLPFSFCWQKEKSKDNTH